MKQLQIELPDNLASRVEVLVREGCFQTESELVRAALLAFLESRRLELTEEFQREDIDWALQQRGAQR